MKKIVIILLSMAFTTVAMAQTEHVKADQKELKNSIVVKKEEKHKAGTDLGHLKVKAALHERKKVIRRRKSIHKQGEHLERLGVKHPIEKAKHEAKAEKEMKKANQ